MKAAEELREARARDLLERSSAIAKVSLEGGGGRERVWLYGVVGGGNGDDVVFG